MIKAMMETIKNILIAVLFAIFGIVVCTPWSKHNRIEEENLVQNAIVDFLDNSVSALQGRESTNLTSAQIREKLDIERQMEDLQNRQAKLQNNTIHKDNYPTNNNSQKDNYPTNNYRNGRR